jgi:tRNA(Ile)-lysidine synthase
MNRLYPVDSGASPEAQARDARYTVFESYLDAGDVLLLGHHLDDQVETVLFRLIRGAGPSGLAGIPEQRQLGVGALLRPLLGITRSQIEDYAVSHELVYLNDSSNNDTRYDRNFLRHDVLPLIESRWPGYRSGFARSAALSGELATSEPIDSQTEYTRFGGPYLPIDVHNARSLHRTLHGWLKGLNVPLPEFVALEEFARQCMQAQGDKLPELESRELSFAALASGYPSLSLQTLTVISIFRVRSVTRYQAHGAVSHGKRPIWGCPKGLTFGSERLGLERLYRLVSGPGVL